MYGDKFVMRLARDLGISHDTLSRWLSGRNELRPDHGVLPDAARLLREKARAMRQVAAHIEDMRQGQYSD